MDTSNIKDFSKFYTPVAVVLGAFVIAAAIFYTDGLKISPSAGGAAANPTSANPAEELGKDLYVDLAGELGLNSKQFEQCLTDRKYKDKVESDFQAGQQLGVRGTPGSFVNGVLVSGAVSYSVLKGVIDEEMLKARVDMGITENDNVKGSREAKVVILEFSDFQCPFCKKFHPTVQQVLQEYGDKVSWVYRHFPLDSIHPQARPAAEASECAAEQGKFWEFADELFGVQL